MTSTDPGGASDARGAGPSVERGLASARWAGAAFAIVQSVLVQTVPSSRPGLRAAAAAFGVDAAAVGGLVWLYLDGENAVAWTLLVLVVLEAAYRWDLRGAVVIAVASGVFYAIVRFAASRELGFPYTVESVTYVAGL